MTDTPDLKRLNIDPDQEVTSEELLRRLIRLVVGIVLVGQDALRNQLPLWEAEAAHFLEEQEQIAKNQPANPSEEPSPPQIPWFPKNWEYRLIGLAFESPNYMKAGLTRLLQTPQKVWRKTAPLRLPLDILGVTDFTNNWAEGFMERLQADTERLERIGASEAQASRALGQVAVLETVDLVLQRLSENPEVRDLVKSQTSGLTEEVIGEVRERSVSADTLIEALVRKVLKQPHLPPDELQLPPQSEERPVNW